MSQDSKGLMTWQRATALVPLALLSAGWTASLASPTTASASGADGRLPDGTEIPGEAVEAPASVTQPGVFAPGVPKGSADASDNPCWMIPKSPPPCISGISGRTLGGTFPAAMASRVDFASNPHRSTSCG